MLRLLLAALLPALVTGVSPAGNLEHGDQVFFTVPRTDRRLTVERGGDVHTFWDHYGAWQRVTLELEEGPGEIFDSSVVFLRSWLDKYVGRQGKALMARSKEAGQKQKFMIRSLEDTSGPIAPGTKIAFFTWDGEAVVVDDPARPGYVTVGTRDNPSAYELLAEVAATPGTAAPTTTTPEPTTQQPTTTTPVPTSLATTPAPTTTTLVPTTTTPVPTTTTTPEPTTTTPVPTTTTPVPTTTPEPNTTTPVPTTTTPEPTTTTPEPSTTTPEPTTTTPVPTTTTPEPTTTQATTTPEPTTTQPTTTAAAGGLLCKDLDASGIAAALTVRTVQLPAALPATCGGFGINPSCRHGFYAAMPNRQGMHALLYNDAETNAIVVLFDGDNEVLRSAVIGTEEVRGLQFTPSGAHLVALISGGTNVYMSPSYFVKMEVPSLEVLWSKPIASPKVGLEKWTPDNSDTIAVSEDRYVLHSAGQCQAEEWCAGHQGNIMQVLDATTGEQIASEGNDWRASHSCKQMVGYSAVSDTFLTANAGDYYPKELLFNGFAKGRHFGKASFQSWGNGGGKQGVTQGAVKADPWTGAFASVWSYGTEDGGPDKLYFATLSPDVAFVQAPTELFRGRAGTEIGGNIAPLSPGRWLVAYTAAESDVVTDYLKVYWDNWGVPDGVRANGARVAIVDSSGSVLGEPVDTSALGAPFPVEINHLVERSDGLGWVFMDGPGKNTARIVQLKFQREP